MYSESGHSGNHHSTESNESTKLTALSYCTDSKKLQKLAKKNVKKTVHMNWMDIHVHVAETAGCDELCEETKEIGRPVKHLLFRIVLYLE